MRYAIEGGAELKAAFDRNPNNIGVDIGTKANLAPLGHAIRPASEAAAFLRDNAVDVSIVATRSLLREVDEILGICARSGVNVLTLCDEALYPWNSSPALTARLDAEAKRGGATITGSGYPDLCYAHFVTTVLGSSHRVDLIRGSSSYNADDYGIALAEHHGVGLSAEEFERQIAVVDAVSDTERQAQITGGVFTPVPMWNANGWLCARLGLTVTRQVQQSVPVFHDKPVYSRTLQRDIPPGHAIGMVSRVVTETREGVRLETEGVGKVYLPGEVDTNEWACVGEPDTRFLIEKPVNIPMICATLVNRIPDVIAAPPGFVTTDRMPPPRWHAHGLWVEG
jgi:hypothetical protein